MADTRGLGVFLFSVMKIDETREFVSCGEAKKKEKEQNEPSTSSVVWSVIGRRRGYACQTFVDEFQEKDGLYIFTYEGVRVPVFMSEDEMKSECRAIVSSYESYKGFIFDEIARLRNIIIGETKKIVDRESLLIIGSDGELVNCVDYYAIAHSILCLIHIGGMPLSNEFFSVFRVTMVPSSDLSQANGAPRNVLTKYRIY